MADLVLDIHQWVEFHLLQAREGKERETVRGSLASQIIFSTAQVDKAALLDVVFQATRVLIVGGQS